MAHQLLNAKHIEAKIMDEKGTDVMRLRVHENIHRLDITPLEEAEIVGYMHYEEKMDVGQIVKQLNKSDAWVMDRLDMVHYPEDVKQAIHEQKLKIGVAKELMRVQDTNIRGVLLDNAIRGGITIQTARAWRQDYEGMQIPEAPETAAMLAAGLLPPPVLPVIRCFTCGVDTDVLHTHAPNICGGCFTEILRQRRDSAIGPV